MLNEMTELSCLIGIQRHLKKYILINERMARVVRIWGDRRWAVLKRVSQKAVGRVFRRGGRRCILDVLMWVRKVITC